MGEQRKGDGDHRTLRPAVADGRRPPHGGDGPGREGLPGQIGQDGLQGRLVQRGEPDRARRMLRQDGAAPGRPLLRPGAQQDGPVAVGGHLAVRLDGEDVKRKGASRACRHQGLRRTRTGSTSSSSSPHTSQYHAPSSRRPLGAGNLLPPLLPHGAGGLLLRGAAVAQGDQGAAAGAGGINPEARPWTASFRIGRWQSLRSNRLPQPLQALRRRLHRRGPRLPRKILRDRGSSRGSAAAPAGRSRRSGAGSAAPDRDGGRCSGGTSRRGPSARCPGSPPRRPPPAGRLPKPARQDLLRPLQGEAPGGGEGAGVVQEASVPKARRIAGEALPGPGGPPRGPAEPRVAPEDVEGVRRHAGASSMGISGTRRMDSPSFSHRQRPSGSVRIRSRSVPA
jgi:hypothetical protein